VAALRRLRTAVGAVLATGTTAAVLLGQASGPGGGLTILTKDGRQIVPVRQVEGHDMVALDDLVPVFQLQVREDQLAGGLTVTRQGRTLVLSSKGLVSSGGRLVSLPDPPVKSGRAWFVPVDFVGRALPLILDVRAEFRRSSRTLLVGDLAVPRVVARSETLAGSVRVTVDVSPRTDHSVLQEPGRLILRFSADAIDAQLPAPAPGELLAGMRVADAPPSLVFDLGPRFASFRASDIPVDASSSRVVVDLLPAGGATQPSPSPSPAAAGQAPAPATEPLPPPPVFEGPVSGVRTIVLDPGHGGEETGAKGPGGAIEKDVTLAVARQLRAVIEARLGLRVLLTRDADETVPLDDRAAIANNNKADLFLSIHANASVSPTPAGAEVFYLSLDEHGDRVKRDADAESTTLPTFNGGQRQVELILWEMAQARHLEDSSVLASIVEQQLRARVPMSPRAIQQAPFRVLVGANMPAVLVELGFLTNPGEESKLTTPEHQGQLVQALYEGVVRFRAYIEGGRQAVPAQPPAGPRGAR
jgi:N-acetylmuramoyl-L-alanine amidase